MAEKRKLISRKNELLEELTKIKKRLHEIKLKEKITHPYNVFANKFEEKLGVRPKGIRKTSITAKAQRDRIRLMKYLIEHGHTKNNPIYYRELVAILGMKNILSILYTGSVYSPLHGGLKVEGKKYSLLRKKSHISKLYVEDMEKAKTYVALMNELIELPLKPFE